MDIVKGEANYPSDFGGVPGGGVWLVMLEEKVDAKGVATITNLDPVLVGVAFYQVEHPNRMVISAHGPRSIYGPETLTRIAEL